MNPERTEKILLSVMLVGGFVYHAIRHPKKTYQLIVHRQGWIS